MSRNFSSAWHEEVNAVSGGEAPVLLLEIDHPDLATPVRVVGDTQDLTHLGNVFTALRFEARLPDDREQGLPRALLEMDNVGRELMQPLESMDPTQAPTCRMIQVLRADPDTIEWEATLTLLDVTAKQTRVTATLGYEDVLNLPAVAVSYRPEVAPGLF